MLGGYGGEVADVGEKKCSCSLSDLRVVACSRPIQLAISSLTRRKARSCSSTDPTASAGSSKLLWRISQALGKLLGSSRLVLHIGQACLACSQAVAARSNMVSP